MTDPCESNAPSDPHEAGEGPCEVISGRENSFSLALGMAGYESFERLPWRDAFLNNAMLMGGMGPLDAPRTNGGKGFAGRYALSAGLVFLAAAGLVFVPVMHRLRHKFHSQQDR